jgi:hypothetical protein
MQTSFGVDTPKMAVLRGPSGDPEGVADGPLFRLSYCSDPAGIPACGTEMSLYTHTWRFTSQLGLAVFENP